jgi:hypothetical protein
MIGFATNVLLRLIVKDDPMPMSMQMPMSMPMPMQMVSHLH